MTDALPITAGRLVCPALGVQSVLDSTEKADLAEWAVVIIDAETTDQ
jgi:hypothetical protein